MMLQDKLKACQRSKRSLTEHEVSVEEANDDVIKSDDDKVNIYFMYIGWVSDGCCRCHKVQINFGKDWFVLR